jgi:hypothetical protein
MMMGEMAYQTVMCLSARPPAQTFARILLLRHGDSRSIGLDMGCRHPESDVGCSHWP